MLQQQTNITTNFTSIEWSWNGLPISLFTDRLYNSQNSELCSSLFIADLSRLRSCFSDGTWLVTHWSP